MENNVKEQKLRAEKEVRELIFMENVDWVESEFEAIQEPNMVDKICACCFLANVLDECEGKF